MANFGATMHDRPTKVDELLGSHLMASLDKLDVIARKIFSGKIEKIPEHLFFRFFYSVLISALSGPKIRETMNFRK